MEDVMLKAKTHRCRRECCLSGEWNGGSKRYIISVSEIYLNFDGASDPIPEKIREPICNDIKALSEYVIVKMESDMSGALIYPKGGNNMRRYLGTMVKKIKKIIARNLAQPAVK
jgi:hypothetical protein